ncbi:MAG: hypothetical protein ABH864_06745 [archaeon]
MAKGESWRTYFQNAYETVAARLPFLRRITDFLPDSVYNADKRHIRLTEERDKLSATSLEVTARLVGTEEDLETTRGALAQAQKDLRKYERIGGKLEKAEKIASELLEALKEQRVAYQRGEARRTVDHETRQKEFGVAISPSGIIIGVSRKALNRLGLADEAEARGTSFYNYLAGESNGLIEVIHDAAGRRAKTASFEGLSIKTPGGKIRKIGEVTIKLHYSNVSPIISSDHPYQTAGETRATAFAAASIVSREAHLETVRARLRRMERTRKNKANGAPERQRNPTETPQTKKTPPRLALE